MNIIPKCAILNMNKVLAGSVDCPKKMAPHPHQAIEKLNNAKIL